jgi:hypothetical protein
MGAQERRESAERVEQAADATLTDEAALGEVQAWEQVSAGRFMPRRIKGSCKGRALG